MVGRGHDHRLQLWRDGYRHHVARNAFPQPDAGIEAVAHDVDETVVCRDVELDVGEPFHEGAQPWQQHLAGHATRHAQPDAAGRKVTMGIDGLDGVFHPCQGRADTGKERLSGFCRRHAARRAMQELHAQLLFQRTQAVRYGGGAQTQARCCAPETAFLDDGGKGGQLGEIAVAHDRLMALMHQVMKWNRAYRGSL